MMRTAIVLVFLLTGTARSIAQPPRCGDVMDGGAACLYTESDCMGPNVSADLTETGDPSSTVAFDLHPLVGESTVIDVWIQTDRMPMESIGMDLRVYEVNEQEVPPRRLDLVEYTVEGSVLQDWVFSGGTCVPPSTCDVIRIGAAHTTPLPESASWVFAGQLRLDAVSDANSRIAIVPISMVDDLGEAEITVWDFACDGAEGLEWRADESWVSTVVGANSESWSTMKARFVD